MSRSMYDHKGCLGEYNFQVPNNHDGVIPGSVRQAVVRVGDLHCDIHFNSVIFKKTDFTGTEVDTLVEVYELAVPSTGGVEDATTLTANLDREAPPLADSKYDINLYYDSVDTPLIVDDTNALIMFRESGFAIKGVASRADNLNIKYSLSPNKHYLIRSTILDGPLDKSQDILVGFLRIVSKYLKE